MNKRDMQLTMLNFQVRAEKFCRDIDQMIADLANERERLMFQHNASMVKMSDFWPEEQDS